MIRNGFRALLGLAAALAVACTGPGDPSARLHVSTKSVEKAASIHDPFMDAFFEVTVTGQESDLWIALDHTDVAIGELRPESDGGDTAVFRIQFKSPADLGSGRFADTATVHVCHDEACTSEIKGSPAEIAITLHVTGGEREAVPAPEEPATPEPGLPALPIAGQHALGYDVIDAEYSDALDAIVLVSSYPSPRLFLHAATGTVQSIALDKSPNAVSVGPDGLSAAVGHDGLITVIDLANIEDPIVTPKKLLNVAADVGDLVLTGNGYVHAIPREDQWVKMRSVEIATGMDTPSFSSIHVPYRAKMHPSGTKMYGTPASLYPSDIERFDISGGAAVLDYDSPYHGEYQMCGNLWMAEGAPRIFTACGVLVRPSDLRSQDLLYAGTLDLFSHDLYSGSRIKSLSHSAERDEVVLIEETEGTCQEQTNSHSCYTHLGLYGGYGELAARYSLAPVAAGGQDYRQRGLFVFHSADGTQRFLISRLWGLADPAQRFLIGTVNVAGASPAPAPEPVVQASAEADLTAAALADIHVLGHDVLDAEYSPALDAIVMVSSYPSNAVYVHDLATHAERSIALTHFPMALSVAPDGLQAAIGHHGKVTIIDLSPVAPAAPSVLTTTADVHDIVLAGNGYAYAFPSGSGYEQLRSLEVATGTETLSSAPIDGGTLARLHPSATRMYAVTKGAFDNIRRYSATGTAQYVGYSPYDSSLRCGNLWLAESGTSIYTACGRTYSAADAQAQDMIYTGTLPLFASSYRIESASDSVEAGQVALIEHSGSDCAPADAATCLMHVGLYSNSSLTLTNRYSLSPLMVAGKAYPQRGMFIFHTADGSQRYLVSRMHGMARPDAEFYIGRLP